MGRKGAFFYLLVSLLFILFAYPLFEIGVWSGKLLALFFTIVLVAGVYVASGGDRRRLTISIFLAVPSVLVLWVDQMIPEGTVLRGWFDIATYSLIILFVFYTIFCVLLHLMKARKVTADILAGAACVYLMLGFGWSLLYTIVERTKPGSFKISDQLLHTYQRSWSMFNYYSFGTLTTLGYGDITPVNIRAQSLAILEAVTGVLFTALLISRLVGMYLHQLNENNGV
ncbi:MAG: hypothetical protein GF409_01930 [Candidatus Omnitrophica bacterium]|nr:hypothetical protein [Candidatus Omnitrophota bacterium]